MSTPCKSCGASVDWTNDGNGWQCFDAGTQTIHWDHCSSRRWQQVKATGTRFVDKINHKGQKISGYANSVHGTKLDHIECLEIVGANYKPDACECGLPPWALCRPDCGHSI